MHARVTRYEGSPHEIETSIKRVKEQVVPSAKTLAGFQAGYWLSIATAERASPSRSSRVSPR